MRLLPLVLFLAACGDDAVARRDWRATDHTQPEGRADSQGQVAASDTPAEDDGQGRARAAAALFRLECASCHGPEGRGDGPAARGMPVPSLATPAVVALTDADLRTVISRGRGAMPAFGARYTEDAIAALAEHVRTLAPR